MKQLKLHTYLCCHRQHCTNTDFVCVCVCVTRDVADKEKAALLPVPSLSDHRHVAPLPLHTASPLLAARGEIEVDRDSWEVPPSTGTGGVGVSSFRQSLLTFRLPTGRTEIPPQLVHYQSSVSEPFCQELRGQSTGGGSAKVRKKRKWHGVHKHAYTIATHSLSLSVFPSQRYNADLSSQLWPISATPSSWPNCSAYYDEAFLFSIDSLSSASLEQSYFTLHVDIFLPLFSLLNVRAHLGPPTRPGYRTVLMPAIEHYSLQVRMPNYRVCQSKLSCAITGT